MTFLDRLFCMRRCLLAVSLSIVFHSIAYGVDSDYPLAKEVGVAKHGKLTGSSLSFIESPSTRSEITSQLNQRWPNGYEISHYCKTSSPENALAFSVMASDQTNSGELTGYTGVVVFNRGEGKSRIRFSDNVEPIRSGNCWVILNRLRAQFLLLKATNAITNSSVFVTFAVNGDVADTIVTSGNSEPELFDTSRIPKLIGYGIERQRNTLDFSISPRGKILAEQLQVPGIFPFLAKGIEGRFGIYVLSAKGRWNLVYGGEWAKFYRNEAKKIRPAVIRSARKNVDNPVARIGALAVFVGILDGIGDKSELERIYSELPSDVRAGIDGSVLATYWTEKKQYEQSNALVSGENHGS